MLHIYMPCSLTNLEQEQYSLSLSLFVTSSCITLFFLLKHSNKHSECGGRSLHFSHSPVPSKLPLFVSLSTCIPLSSLPRSLRLPPSPLLFYFTFLFFFFSACQTSPPRLPFPVSFLISSLSRSPPFCYLLPCLPLTILLFPFSSLCPLNHLSFPPYLFSPLFSLYQPISFPSLLPCTL